MINLLHLTLNNLKVIFRKKSSIIVFLVLPIVGILVSIGAYSSFGDSAQKVGLTVLDNSLLAEDFKAELGKQENFKLIDVDKSEINSKISTGKVECVLIIPEGFSDSIYNNSFKEIKIASAKGDTSTVWIKNYVNIYIKNLLDISEASGGDKERFDRIYETYRQGKLNLKINYVEDSHLNKGITSQSLGFLIFFMMLGAGFTAEMILKDKRNRTYFRICSTPVNARTYLAANTITSFIIVFIQIMIALTVITKVLKINTYIPVWQLLIVLLAIGLVAIALGLMVVSFSKDSLQSNTMQNLIVTPTCMLGGCYWSVEMMPKNIQKVADFIPQKWAIEAIQKLQAGNSFLEVSQYIAIVLAFAAAFFLIAVYRFSRNDNVNIVA